MKLNALKFATAAGILCSLHFSLSIILALWHVPGYVEYADLLSKIYGFYGYSITWTGVLTAAFLGFIEGFVHVGVLVWLYNNLVGNPSEKQ